jgi:hypothetical protein
VVVVGGTYIATVKKTLVAGGLEIGNVDSDVTQPANKFSQKVPQSLQPCRNLLLAFLRDSISHFKLCFYCGLNCANVGGTRAPAE